MEPAYIDLILAIKEGKKPLPIEINSLIGEMQMPALHYAIFYNDPTTSEWLLEHGAILDARDKRMWTAIQRAVFNSTSDMVTLLSKQGALFEHPNFEKAYWGTLDDKEIHLNLVDSLGSTLMHYAAANAQIGILSLLESKSFSLFSKDNNGNTPLFRAAHNGHVETMAWLVEKGARLNEKNKHGNTALLLAASRGHTGAVMWLVENGANISHKDSSLYTALLYAAANNHTATVIYLAKQGVPVNEKDKAGDTALLHAVQYDNTEAAICLMTHRANVNAKGKSGNVALHHAVRHANSELLKALIEHGASLNEKNDYGNTPLHIATYLGHMETVVWLVEHGATTKEKNEEGMTVLILAASNDDTEMVIRLLEKDAPVNEKDKSGNTALFYAIHHNNTEVAIYLIRYGANVNDKDKFGNRPLHYAACHNNAEIIKALIKHRANLNKKNKDGKTALHLAAENGHMKSVVCLVEHGASVKEVASTRNRMTALLLASLNGHTAIVAWLLAHGACITEKDRDRYTPLLCAAYNGHTETVAWLLKHGASLDERNKRESSTDSDGSHNFSCNERNETSRNAFLWAAHNGHIETIECLLQYGADINSTCSSGCTALSDCVDKGYSHIAKTLVVRGIQLNNGFYLNISPLNNAKYRGHKDIADCIEKAKERDLYWRAYQSMSSIEKQTLNYDAQTNPLKIAAEGGHPQAQIAYAMVCLANNDVKRAIAFLGYAHYQKAGTAESFYTLAEIYAKGLGEITPNIEQAALYYKKAASLGHPDLEAQSALVHPRLRENYLEALLVLPQEQVQYELELMHANEEEAASWLQKATVQEEAVWWYRKAARRKDADAQKRLTQMASYSYLAAVLLEEIKLFEQGCELAMQGYSEGQFYVGYCYLKGRGIKQDIKEALSRFTSVPNQDNLWQGAAKMALGFINSTGYAGVLGYQDGNDGGKNLEEHDANALLVFLKELGQKKKNGFFQCLIGFFYEVHTQLYAGAAFKAVSYYKEALTRGDAYLPSIEFALQRAGVLVKDYRFQVLLSQQVQTIRQAQDYKKQDIELHQRISSISEEDSLDALLKKPTSLESNLPVNLVSIKEWAKYARAFLQRRSYMYPLLNRAIYNYHTQSKAFLKLPATTNLNIILVGYYNYFWKEIIPQQLTQLKLLLLLPLLPKREKEVIQGLLNYFKEAVKEAKSREKDKSPGTILIHEAHQGTRLLNAEASAKLMPLGEVTSDAEQGSHPVVILNGVHYKCATAGLVTIAPGIEYMVDRLSKLLVGHGSAPTTLLKVTQGKRQIIYQASKTVTGMDLEYILKYKPGYLDYLDRDNFSAMAILGMLTNPQDGKADNYMVEVEAERDEANQEKIKALHIVGIDNDMAFGESVKHNYYSNGEEYFASQVRNVIFLLPQMNLPVSETFRKEFLSRSPELLMIEWLKALAGRNNEYDNLLIQAWIQPISATL